MRKIVCKKATQLECDFAAEGDLNTEVKRKFHDHLVQAHPDMTEEDRAKAEKAGAKQLPWL